MHRLLGLGVDFGGLIIVSIRISLPKVMRLARSSSESLHPSDAVSGAQAQGSSRQIKLTMIRVTPSIEPYDHRSLTHRVPMAWTQREEERE
jgi:hypothetical protein